LLFKAISKNEYTQIAQDFCSFSRRKKGHIASYATLFTTQKMGKKTSKLGIFFAGNRLSKPVIRDRAKIGKAEAKTLPLISGAR
jgi:hypothetical protein